MRKNVQLKFDMSDMFISGVYDMKNSLGVLVNAAENLFDSAAEKSPSQAEGLAHIQYESARINAKLSNLLTVHQLKGGEIFVNIEEHYVKDTVDDLISQNHPLFKSQGIAIEVSCPDDLVWYYDRFLVGSVLQNVLINSARYCKTRVMFQASATANGLKICIADDGDGFPKKMIDCASRFEANQYEECGTASLGLLYAHQIFNLHEHDGNHGKISIKNSGALGGGELQFVLP